MDVLQHYTSREGLEGIARSRVFWATDFFEVNDRSEMLYAYIESTKAAGQIAWNQLTRSMKSMFPGFNPKATFDADKMVVPLFKHFEDCFVTGGAARLYLASFVTPIESHQVQLGVLTMWHKYTNNEGFCLVFDRGEVESLLDRERARFDYQSLDLVKVSYGFDPNSEVELMFQSTQRMLGIVEMPFLKLVDRRKWWPELEYARELIRLCARYKSPFWQDEREVRIAAIPTEKRWPTPAERRKQIHTSPAGRHYLVVGEAGEEGIEPIQVIVGPKASQDIDDIIALFRRRPEVLRPSFPLR